MPVTTVYRQIQDPDQVPGPVPDPRTRPDPGIQIVPGTDTMFQGGADDLTATTLYVRQYQSDGCPDGYRFVLCGISPDRQRERETIQVPAMFQYDC